MTGRGKGFVVLAVLLVLAAIAFFIIWRPEIAAIEQADVPTSSNSAEVARGYTLAQLGNCQSCHTTEGGEPYAGGRAMDTPFGTIYSVNITPDRETGIGTWSRDAFTRAMRTGVDREGTHLYPAFPYTQFTKMTDGDIDALYAYLHTVPAVQAATPENGLPFPFNIRALMAGWKLLFLDKGPESATIATNDSAQYGRYLVEGVAHCGACHTPRNFVGARKSGKPLAGAEIDGWYAPALQGERARAWTKARMKTYLSTGFSRDHGAAAGPMGETVVNLSNAAPREVDAIATYVAGLTGAAQPDITLVDNGMPKNSEDAHALWVGACATCHTNTSAMVDGATGPSFAIPLSSGAAVHEDKPLNVVQTIAGGIDAYRDAGGPYMPAFKDTLTQEQIADLTRYVRARFSDQPAWDDIGATVEKITGETEKGDGQ